MGDLNQQVLEVLERSRTLGFLGPGPVEDHLHHARAFARAVDLTDPPRRVLDLGSGGGVPGLILAGDWPQTSFTLLDGSSKRCDFLEEAVEKLVWTDRVSVICGRAEDLGHNPSLRASFDLVVARSFAAPSVTAECAAGFMKPGAKLVVSEPPEKVAGERWNPEGLVELGLGPARLINEVPRLAVMELVSHCPDRFPRRVGVPAKRPLF